jgi:chromosome segregation ATPase
MLEMISIGVSLAIVLFVLAMFVSSPFRLAVIKRVRGEAAVAAEQLNAPMKNLAAAVAQNKQQRDKLQQFKINLQTELNTVSRHVKEKNAKREQYDSAAKRWGANGAREKVAECVAAINQIDAEIKPLQTRKDFLEAKVLETDKMVVQIDQAIHRAEASREQLNTRLSTAQMTEAVNKELSAISVTGAEALIQEAERIVAKAEDRAAAYSDSVAAQNLEKSREEELLSVTGQGDPDFDSQVNSYLK